MVSQISGGFLDWSEDICNVSFVSLVPNPHPPTLGVQMTTLHSCLFVTCRVCRQQLGPLALRTTGTGQPTCCHLSVVVATYTANCSAFQNDIFRTHGMFFITARLLKRLQRPSIERHQNLTQWASTWRSEKQQTRQKKKKKPSPFLLAPLRCCGLFQSKLQGSGASPVVALCEGWWPGLWQSNSAQARRRDPWGT